MNTWYANTPAGRWILGIKNDYKIIKLTPNSIHQYLGIKNGKHIIEAKFFADNFVEEILSPIEEQINIAQRNKFVKDKYKAFLHYAGLERRNYPIILFTTDPFSTTSTACGRIYVTGAGTWTAARDAASGTFDAGLGKVSGETGFEVDRLFLSFNTSSIADAATITSAGLVVYGNTDINGAAYSNTDTTDVDLVQSTPADPSTIAGGDFDQAGTTVAASIAMGSINQSGSNTFSLDTQLAWISKTGYTNLSFRNSRDTDNSQPTGVNRVYFLIPGDSWGGTKPVLNVTYTPPASTGNKISFMSMMGVGN